MGWLEAWHDSYNNPRLFVEGVVGDTPSPSQAKALDDIARYDKVAIRSAHGVGKTRLLGWICAWFMTTRCNYKIPVTANSQDQLRDVTWAEICKVFRKLPPQLLEQYEVGLERIYLRGDRENNFAVPRTASRDKPEALQGFHAENLLFLIEEASGIEDIVFELAAGALSTPRAKIILVGNPTRTTGYFYRAFHQNREYWCCHHIPFSSVVGQPWADAGYPAKVADEYGETSNAYRVRVLGEFPQEEDDAVIPLRLVEAAINRDVRAVKRAAVWGVDVAYYGSDRSALLKRKGNIIDEPAKIWRQKNTMQSAGIVAREFFETPMDLRPSAVNVDVIGYGAGVLDRLRELGLPAFGINVAETPEEPERFPRRRDELWWLAREWFASLDCRIINDAALISDLTAPTYKLLSNGKLQVESKDAMRERHLRSPDVADAFCLTFAGGEYAQYVARESHARDEFDSLDPDRPWRSEREQQTHAISED